MKLSELKADTSSFIQIMAPFPLETEDLFNTEKDIESLYDFILALVVTAFLDII
jgi:hypothetical protein